jgi:hypothetical protein
MPAGTAWVRYRQRCAIPSRRIDEVEMDGHMVHEKEIGTYLKVIRFGEWGNPDAFVVLYLRPSGRFWFAGYWRGYERSAAAGVWRKSGSEIHLSGRGSLSTDASPTSGGQFVRVFAVNDAYHTPSLFADEEVTGWSLLSWRGPYMYVGKDTIIDPDRQWLPGSLSQVDQLIDTLVPV